MAEPDRAARKIGRFSVAVWLVGLVVLAGSVAAALPGTVPHLFDGRQGGSAPVAADGSGGFSGSGNAVVEYKRPAGYEGPFEVSADGDGEIQVAVDDPRDPEWPRAFLWSTDDQDEPATELLATSRDRFSLHIEAKRNWHVQVRRAGYREVTDSGGAVTGTGDAVLRYEGDAVLAAVSFEGDANVAVYTLQEAERDLAVNEIGNYSTRFSWQPAPVTYFKVEAGGARWTFRILR